MAIPSYPSVNGIRYDWSSVEIDLGGKKYFGIKDISYKHSLEPGEVYGTHAQILGRTRGQYKSEASITLFKEEYSDLLEALGDGYMERSFDIIINYADANQSIVTDKVIGCRIKSADESHAQGTEALVVKLDLHVMMILEHGKKPINNMLGVSG